MKRKLYHLLGESPTGDQLLANRCGTDELSVITCVKPGDATIGDADAVTGSLVPANDVDGHYEFKRDRVRWCGPIKVVTPAYRDGWKRTFGKNGVN